MDTSQTFFTYKKNKIKIFSIGYLFLLLFTFILPIKNVHADITSNLVGYWKFEAGTASSTVDSSGNSSTGSMTTGVDWTTGKMGNYALVFDGTTGRDNMSNPSVLNDLPAAAFSAAFWVKPTIDNATEQYILVKQNTTALGWRIAIDSQTSDAFRFFDDYNGTDLGVKSAANSVTYNAWQHVVMTYDGSATAAGIKFYINGVETSSYLSGTDGTSGRIGDSTRPFTLGAHQTGGRPFTGNLDDVRLYTRALSASDVRELYAYNGIITTTGTPSSVATSTLTLNGSIVNSAGTDPTQSGFAYGTASTLSTVIATTTLGAQTGNASFSSNVSSLTPNTVYYFRAYVTNALGTSYGSILSTTTLAVSAPTVTTQSASSITSTTVTGNGNITVTGNINPTVRGFVYGATTAYGATTTSSGDFSTGAYTGSITGLTCNITYHYTAYATNSQGTSYGSDTTFTTSACVQTISTDLPTSVSTSTLTLNATISSTGGANATQSGFAYGTVSTLATVIATSTLGSQTGAVSFTADIVSLTSNTTYYFRAYTTNSAGTTFGSILSTTTLSVVKPTVTTQAASSVGSASAILNGTITSVGRETATQSGFTLGTSATLSTGSATSTLGISGATSFTETVTSLSGGTTYYFRPYATNSGGTGYGTILSFTTSAVVAPTVTTGSISSINTTSATLSGSITATGGANATQYGFVYASDIDFTNIIASTTEGSYSGTGSISSSISSLTCNTIYYLKAYATNSAGIGYGSSTSFTTSACVTNSNQSNNTSSGSSFVNSIISLPIINQIPVIKNILEKTTNKTVIDNNINDNNTILNNKNSDNAKVIEKDTFPTVLVNVLTKYPELEKDFKKLNILTVDDIGKIANNPIEIPVISDLKNLPPETIITQAGNGNVNLVSSIALDNSGEIEQRVQTIVNSKIKLAIKPISKANSITGYITLKRGVKSTALELPFSSLTASVLNTVNKTSKKDDKIKENILISQFTYSDNDGDGIYTADVNAPSIDGTYAVKTIIDYKDKKLGKKEVDLVAVISREGYVYEIIQGKEARIPNAKVSVMDINTGTLWNANKYNQINPQITDETGKYSFVLPKGNYYITVEAKEYEKYTGNKKEIKISSGIQDKIEMKKERGLFYRMFRAIGRLFGSK